MALIRVEGNNQWSLTSPRSSKLSEGDLEISLKVLSKSLPSILAAGSSVSADALSRLDIILGPTLLTKNFLMHWISHLDSHYNIHLKLIDRHFDPEVSYATLTTIPPLSSDFPLKKYDICRATTEEEIIELVPLYIDFTSCVLSRTISTGEASTILEQAMHRKQLWFVYYREDGQPETLKKTISGFLLLARCTPRTIAIKNLYVSPSFRRKGIAEALVCATTRIYLGAQPLGFELRGVDYIQPKKEVCLGVLDPGAKQLYVRCGFKFEGDRIDTVTGDERWYPISLLGVTPADG